MPTVAFADARVDSGDGARLETAMRAEVEAMYPGLDMTAPDMPPAGPDELNPPHGVFLVGYRDGEAVCCGGIKTLAPGVCEFKRMYVTPAARGSGVGRALLGALEERARALGFHTARLDTGERQTVAQRLYLSAGYRPMGNFNANPVATFFGEKRITGG
ncbi:GNAT family N-acetyltransferase [Conexibacter sp. DBS9H8]|uniref:GNAT family N-acetyltransferase n=1 Tax=Conexibacter sp. DBS9H8 TaxID=2937801 RepID=UPI00200CDD57|nr:GNAT family N-acetyltransferase [Conexibacter sp. DBS9H8]